MGPAASYRLEDTCCRRRPVLDGAAAFVTAVTGFIAANTVVTKALVLRVRALAGEGPL
jgi:tRNA A37 threonylcarbamoyladenosine dehydratase